MKWWDFDKCTDWRQTQSKGHILICWPRSSGVNNVREKGYRTEMSDLETDCRTWGDENNEIALLVGLKVELNGDRNYKSGKKLFVCSAVSAADARCLNVAAVEIWIAYAGDTDVCVISSLIFFVILCQLVFTSCVSWLFSIAVPALIGVVRYFLTVSCGKSRLFSHPWT